MSTSFKGNKIKLPSSKENNKDASIELGNNMDSSKSQSFSAESSAKSSKNDIEEQLNGQLKVKTKKNGIELQPINESAADKSNSNFPMAKSNDFIKVLNKERDPALANPMIFRSSLTRSLKQ